jgi:hypothetical protein
MTRCSSSFNLLRDFFLSSYVCIQSCAGQWAGGVMLFTVVTKGGE